MSERLPIFVDFHGRRVVIFGGGSVGERKAAFFPGADVVVMSDRFTPGLEEMARAGQIKLERTSVKPEDVKGIIGGAFLVVAATGDPLLNEAIVREATASNALANSATGEGTVILPSVIKKSGVQVAISTGGRSPAMAKFLRQWLEASLGEDIERMLGLQERVRRELKASVPDQKRRETIARKILEDPGVWDALEVSPEAAYELAMRHLTEKR